MTLNRNFTESKKWPRFDKIRWSRLVKLGGHATQNSVATVGKNMQVSHRLLFRACDKALALSRRRSRAVIIQKNSEHICFLPSNAGFAFCAIKLSDIFI
jgi:hypothetical protein